MFPPLTTLLFISKDFCHVVDLMIEVTWNFTFDKNNELCGLLESPTYITCKTSHSLLFLEKNTIHGERMSTIVLPHEFLYSVMRQTLHCRDSSIDL